MLGCVVSLTSSHLSGSTIRDVNTVGTEPSITLPKPGQYPAKFVDGTEYYFDKASGGKETSASFSFCRFTGAKYASARPLTFNEYPGTISILSCSFENIANTGYSGGAGYSFDPLNGGAGYVWLKKRYNHTCLTVNSSNFTKCSAIDFGGAMIILAEDDVLINSCRFNNCSTANPSSAAFGGGFYLTGWEMPSHHIRKQDILVDCVFVDCTTTKCGGGAFVTGLVDMSIVDTRFEHCEAVVGSITRGGGIYAEDLAAVTVQRCHFIGCKSKHAGGAIHSDRGASLSVSDTLVQNCYSGTTGTIYIHKRYEWYPLSLSRVLFDGNTVGDDTSFFTTYLMNMDAPASKFTDIAIIFYTDTGLPTIQFVDCFTTIHPDSSGMIIGRKNPDSGKYFQERYIHDEFDKIGPFLTTAPTVRMNETTGKIELEMEGKIPLTSQEYEVTVKENGTGAETRLRMLFSDGTGTLVSGSEVNLQYNTGYTITSIVGIVPASSSSRMTNSIDVPVAAWTFNLAATPNFLSFTTPVDPPSLVSASSDLIESDHQSALIVLHFNKEVSGSFDIVVEEEGKDVTITVSILTEAQAGESSKFIVVGDERLLTHDTTYTIKSIVATPGTDSPFVFMNDTITFHIPKLLYVPPKVALVALTTSLPATLVIIVGIAAGLIYDFLKELQKNGCDMNKLTVSSGETVAHRILRRGIDLKENGYEIENVSEINSLLQTAYELGTDLNLPNASGETITHLCCQFGLISHLDMIISLSCSLNQSISANNQSQAQNSTPAQINSLPTYLATTNRRTGWTVIHYCLCSDSPLSTLEHLIEKYPAVTELINVPDDQGLTPLHWMGKGHGDDGSTETRDIDKYSEEELDVSILTLLLKHGAHLNIQDCSYHTPLHYSVISNRFEIASFLLKHHANPDGIDPSASQIPNLIPPPLSPLAWSVINQNTDMMYLLANADKVFETMHGMTDPQAVGDTPYFSGQPSIISRQSVASKISLGSPLNSKGYTNREFSAITPRIFGEQDWKIPNPVLWLVRLLPSDILAKIDASLSARFWDLVEEEGKLGQEQYTEERNLSEAEINEEKKRIIESIYELFPKPFAAVSLKRGGHTLRCLQEEPRKSTECDLTEPTEQNGSQIGDDSTSRSGASVSPALSSQHVHLTLFLNSLHPLPLHIASFLGHTGCVTSLLLNGASPLIPHSPTLATLGVFHSFRQRYPRTVLPNPISPAILSLPSNNSAPARPASIGIKPIASEDGSGWFAIELAAAGGSEETVLALLDGEVMRQSCGNISEDFSLLREDISKLNVCLSQLPRRMDEVGQTAKKLSLVVPPLSAPTPLSTPLSSPRKGWSGHVFEGAPTEIEEKLQLRSVSTLSTVIGALVSHLTSRLKELCPSLPSQDRSKLAVPQTDLSYFRKSPKKNSDTSAELPDTTVIPHILAAHRKSVFERQLLEWEDSSLPSVVGLLETVWREGSQLDTAPSRTNKTAISQHSVFTFLVPFVRMCLQLALTSLNQRASVFHVLAARNDTKLVESIYDSFLKEGMRMLTALPAGEGWKRDAEKEARKNQAQPSPGIDPDPNFSPDLISFFLSLLKSLFGVLVDGTDSSLSSPLAMAISFRHHSFINLLLNYHPELTILDVNGDSLAHICIKHALQPPHLQLPSPTSSPPPTQISPEFTTQFLSTLQAQGVTLGQQNANGITPLHEAVQARNLKAVELLLSKVGGGDLGDTVTGNTPLHVATINTSLEAVQLIIRLSPALRIDVQNHQRQTALHLAVLARCVEIVGELLKHGADPNIRDRKGWTALHHACTGMGVINEMEKAKQTRIVEHLIRNGAHVLIPTIDGLTAFDLLSSPQDRQYLGSLCVENIPRCIPLSGLFERENKQKRRLLESSSVTPSSPAPSPPTPLTPSLAHSTALQAAPVSSPSRVCPSCSSALSIMSSQIRPCYLCSRSVCSRCEGGRIPLLVFGQTAKQSLCQSCFKLFQSLSDQSRVNSLIPDRIAYSEEKHGKTHFPQELLQAKKVKKVVLDSASLFTVMENAAKLSELKSE
ncbi:hypothetical protein BLNAU_9321 [Blattamonas nauphoetae]|uniref:FYVE-type domain-containing protein n=1 Tax=Blattamonas nauphoetae TaxID=2049346 RepID=A0ABQ9XWC3_9EUKA|nr:hypothetical protein BLNAU_9321 [Blattamonas nauphoetae]